MYFQAESGGPPTLDNGLINGTNIYGDVGERFKMTFAAGKTYRIRLVNGAIDTHFKFMIDNHNLTVIAHDLVPIVPYDTQMVSIGMGQRYDIIVKADQGAGNFWLRAIPQVFCSDNDNTDNIKGIVMYDAADTSDPTTTAYAYDDNCDDEDMANLVPYVALNAAAETIEDDFAVTLGFVSSNVGTVVKWYMAGTTFEVEVSIHHQPLTHHFQRGTCTNPTHHIVGNTNNRTSHHRRRFHNQQPRNRAPQRQRMGLLRHVDRSRRSSSYPSPRSRFLRPRSRNGNIFR